MVVQEVLTDSFARLIETHEESLVRDIFADNMLARSVGFPPSIRSRYEYKLCVRPEALNLPSGSFGDVDALLIETGRPDRASAVQFKRVKISQASFDTGEISGLKKLPKLVRQANELHAIGFANVWLTVIIVADVRPLTKGESYAFTPPQMMGRVIDAIPLGSLAKGIGVTVCEITQVSDEPANMRGGSGGQILQSAIERIQGDLLTAAIAGLFSPAAT